MLATLEEYNAFATGRKPPSKKVFLRNIEEKENDPGFSGDMEALPGVDTVYTIRWLPVNGELNGC